MSLSNYDATIGRFISPDTIIPNPANPQSFNRYSYCLNNPLKYVDPSGHNYEYYLGMMTMFMPQEEGPAQPVVEAAVEAKEKATGVGQGVPRNETIIVKDIFQLLMPYAQGELEVRIDTTWNDNNLTLDIFSSTRTITPETSSCFLSAELNIGDKSYLITLDRVEGTILVKKGTSVQATSVTIEVSLDSKITLDLRVDGWTNSSDPSDYNYHMISYSKRIDIWDGS